MSEPAYSGETTTLRSVPTNSRAVPRITIHGFFQGADGQALESAGNDRRLSSVHMEIHDGGIVGAIEHYANAPTPNLIVVEVADDREKLFTDLQRLAEVCDPGTKVIVVGKMNDVSLYRELIRQGVSEYMVSPVSPVNFIDTISALYVDPDAPPIGHTYAFIGTKGGSGSSTIAHNVAWCLSKALQEDTIVVDLDIPFGTAGLDFNQEGGQGSAEALRDPGRLDDVLLERLLIKEDEHLSLLAAPASLDLELEPASNAIETLVNVVKQSVPHIVLDVPHVWSAWTKRALLSSDEIIMTATPDLASLRNTKQLYDHLVALRPNDSAPRVVLNKIGLPKRPEIPEKEFEDAMGAPVSLVVAYDMQTFGAAANNGQMIGEVSAGHKAAEGFRTFAMQLAGRDASPRKQTSSFKPFLEKLTGKKG